MAAAEGPKKPRARKATETKKPAARKTATRARKAAAQPQVTFEQVAFRAFELWEHGAPGDALEHWLAAEHELLAA